MNTIFHPTDFSSRPEIAFGHALKIALATGSRLTIFHVNESLEELNWHDFPSVRSTLEKWDVLPKEIPNQAISQSKMDVEKILYRGKEPSASILQHLERHPADLIVLATHQLGIFSSISEPVARKSHIMTLFIPLSTEGFVSLEDGSLHLQNILMPITHDPSPQSAVQAITTLLHDLNCQETLMTFLYIGDEENCPTIQNTISNGNYIVKNGDVVGEILQTAEDINANLIAMPTQGHQGFLDALRGSTTEQVVRKANCPVLAIPSD